MKKIIELLTTVMILAGSLGMVTVAAVDPSTCEHPNVVDITVGYPYTTTYTHPAWVANKPNGEPIFATCTVTATKQNWRRICSTCGQIFNTWTETVSETHSIHH